MKNTPLFKQSRQSLLLIALIVGLTSSTASAITVPAGGTWINGGFGLGSKLDSQVGGSDFFLMLNAGVEHSLNSNFSVVGDIDWGLAGTVPLRLHAGARLRITGLKLPLSPWFQAQLSTGMLFNALGATLPLVGVRPGIGTDYFVTSKLSASAALHFELNSTLGERPAFYGQWEFLLMANYLF